MPSLKRFGKAGVLVITGPVGIGKTRMLEIAASGGVRLGVVDLLRDLGGSRGLDGMLMPFGTPRRELDQDRVDVVAVDHIDFPGVERAAVQEAADWAAMHGKPLWLVDVRREAIDALGLDLAGPVASLHLSCGPQHLPEEVTARHGRHWLLPAFLRLKGQHASELKQFDKREGSKRDTKQPEVAL